MRTELRQDFRPLLPSAAMRVPAKSRERRWIYKLFKRQNPDDLGNPYTWERRANRLEISRRGRLPARSRKPSRLLGALAGCAVTPPRDVPARSRGRRNEVDATVEALAVLGRPHTRSVALDAYGALSGRTVRLGRNVVWMETTPVTELDCQSSPPSKRHGPPRPPWNGS